MNFKEYIKEQIPRFVAWKKDTVRVISHLDCDGICSAAVLIKTLNHLNWPYELSIIPQLDEEQILLLAKEPFEHIIFTDLGSGQLPLIQKYLKKKILILDHHELGAEQKDENLIHINPHLFGIDGSHEISGAGTVYLFCKEAVPELKAAHLAIIGAIGDVQDQQGMHSLNQEILQQAIKEGTLEVKKGLKFFGLQTRPLHKILEYSSDCYIPGVTGSESGAIQFLKHLGIEPKQGSKWRTYHDLTDEELQKLSAAIIIKRKDESEPSKIFGDVYVLPQEKKGPLRDGKEFSTLLNACGRMNNAEVGIAACLNDPAGKRKALNTLKEYRKEIVKGLRWYRSVESTMPSGENYRIINGRDEIPATIIGTIASILSKSNEFPDKTFILGLAYTKDKIKVSIRITGMNTGIDLKAIISEIVKRSGGEAGGHNNAAGAILQRNQEEAFIAAAQEIFEKQIEKII